MIGLKIRNITSASQPLMTSPPPVTCWVAWTRLNVVIVVQMAGTMRIQPGNRASSDIVGFSPSSSVRPVARPRSRISRLILYHQTSP